MKHRKIVLFAGIILAVFACNHFWGWSAYISDIGNLNFLKQMTGKHLMTAILLYTVITVAGCVVLTLPGVTFAILAGVMFDPVLATICCSGATTVGAMAAFLAGRFFLKDSIKPIVIKNQYLKRWLFDESGKNGLFVLMITRLVPLFPYNLQNFAYGVTDISFGAYSICSFLFMLPGTAMYTLGTAGLTNKENRFLYIGIAAVLAVIVMGLGLFFKKKYVLQTEEGQKKDEGEEDETGGLDERQR